MRLFAFTFSIQIILQIQFFFPLKNFIFQFFFLIFSSILSYIYYIPSNISLFSIRTFLGNSILILRPDRPPASLRLGCGRSSPSLNLRLRLSVSDQTRPSSSLATLHSDIVFFYFSCWLRMGLLLAAAADPARPVSSFVSSMYGSTILSNTNTRRQEEMMINCLNTIMVCSNICYRRSEKMRNVYICLVFIFSW